MPDLLDAAREIDTFCRSRQWHYCIIGGMALMRWGEPRMTRDVDLTLLTGFGNEEAFISALLAEFVPLLPDAVDFALRNRVLPVRTDSGFKVDIALGGLPFEESAVSRATDFRFAPDVLLRTCSAEDLVVMKTFAGRPQDWIDVEGILVRQDAGLDWRYIYSQLQPLADLKGAPELVEQLRVLERKRRAKR